MKSPFKIRRYNDAARPHLKFVVNYREAGKRARRFFEKKIEADTFVHSKQIEQRAQGREGAEFPTALRVMAAECAELLKPHRRTIKDATTHFLAFLEAANRSCTIDAMITELIRTKEDAGKSSDYVRDMRSILGRFAKSFTGRIVSTITSAEVEKWILASHNAPVTRNNYQRYLVVAWNFALRRKYATENVAEHTEKAATASEQPGILTVSQAARLLEAAEPDVLPFIAIGAFAGLRPREIERLQWSNVHFDSGVIEVTAQGAKTGSHRYVTIQPNLAQWLKPYVGHTGPVACESLRSRMNATRRAAGITTWESNALRHSYGSYHLAHHKDCPALALQMGNSPAVIFKHYYRPIMPHVAAAYWQISPAESASKVVSIGAA